MPTFASSSKLPPAAGPKSSGASGSYTSAADLGYVPQPEAGPSTRARDETVGQAGEWEVVAPPPRSSPAPQLEGDAVSAVGEVDVVVPARLPARKREFGSTAEDDDPDEARSFKFKRHEKQAYLDDDDDLPEIKLKRPAGGAAAVKQEMKPLPGFRGVEWGSRLPAEGTAAALAPEAVEGVPAASDAPPVEGETEDVKPPGVKEEPVVAELPPPKGGGMFKKRRGPPKGVGKRPTI
jgi:hypothetical protein